MVWSETRTPLSFSCILAESMDVVVHASIRLIGTLIEGD